MCVCYQYCRRDVIVVLLVVFKKVPKFCSGMTIQNENVVECFQFLIAVLVCLKACVTICSHFTPFNFGGRNGPKLMFGSHSPRKHSILSF